MTRYNNMTELIGDTPVVKLNRIVPRECADIYVKLELFNPSRSVKDRAAFGMIDQAEKDDIIQPGDTIIEPTSGNTGIGLAMAAAAKGYQAIFVLPDNMTEERINLLKAYGAEVVLTPAADKMPGAIGRAQELKEEIPNAFIPQQFENYANPEIHRATTAVEILDQMDNDLDGFVATAGTGGTITGTGETLKDALPGLHVAVVEPSGSPVLSGGEPGKHKLVGTSPGFVPDILNPSVYDEIIQIDDDDAVNMFRKIAREEGLFIGPSAAAAVHAAIMVGEKLGTGKKVLCIAPDSGERYLSMGLID